MMARRKKEAPANPVAVVTGASRGIGRAIAVALGEAGCKVIINYASSEASALEVCAEIKEKTGDKGGEGIPIKCNVGSASEISAMFAKINEEVGPVDILVNNAGITKDMLVMMMRPTDFTDVIDLNLNGVFYASQAAFTGSMMAQKRGRIINIASIVGQIGNPGQANYAAAKLGIVGLSKSIALDMQRYNVRSNCISPFAWSRLIGTIPSDTPEQQARLARMQVMETAKIAPLAVYLCSDQAKAVSGQIFAVRANEIFLMSQSRPQRSVHRSEGWTPESIAAHAMPSMEASFYPLVRSGDVFNWDPI